MAELSLLCPEDPESPQTTDDTPWLYAAADTLGVSRHDISELPIEKLSTVIALALCYRNQARMAKA